MQRCGGGSYARVFFRNRCNCVAQVKSQNDTDALAKAKEVVYKAGFYEGTMLIGEYAGLKVMDAKPKTRQLLIDQGACNVASVSTLVV